MTNTNFPTGSAIASLITGYKQFKSQYFEQSKTFDNLVQDGQKPKVLAIACCDSRVDPAIVTGCKPGELFVVRNVANLVPPFSANPQHHGTSAALEFGVINLGVSDIILFGHSHCGGIRALIEAPEERSPSNFINAWMDIAIPAKQHVLQQYPHCSLDQQAYHCEKKSLGISLNNLLTFPWIKQRVAAQQLFLHVWYFNLATGAIETYQPASDNWTELCA
ncbi:MAG: carbonic anhydrase [Gammaproteobacteria bacterium]|nr:carbonic anhydrase [Gammaproteobacteria bacterium]